MEALSAAERIVISAGTLAETLIVASRRGVTAEVRAFVQDFRIIAVSVTDETAQRMAHAYSRWGKGVHPAGLNFGDCFAYALAEQLGCPLLYVGNDFPRTDIQSALP